MQTDVIGAEEEGDLGARTPSDGAATVQPPALASEPAILDLVATELAASGVAGEDQVGRLLYLVVTSRLLERPCSVAVKGPSAGGKSFIVEQVLGLFPPEAYCALTAMSERSLIYDTRPLSHRMLVLYEAAGMSGDMASYLVRSLLSEGRIDYMTVVKGKTGPEPRHITREGPTGLITTTTHVSLHPENETRLISLTITDTPAQTRAIMLAHAEGQSAKRDRSAWHELQAWLTAASVDVVIPYAATLARAIPPAAVRLRRDFRVLLTLIRAHALLQQVSRARDRNGAVVATIDDYAVVRGLVTDLMTESTERSVTPAMRETVAAVVSLTASDILDEGVPATRVATELGIDKSSALRRVRGAIARGFLRDLEERRGRPHRLVSGDPLPEDSELLPTAADLERLHGCTPDPGDLELSVEADYPASAWLPDVVADDVLPDTQAETPVAEPGGGRSP